MESVALRFVPFAASKRGTVRRMLMRSYAELPELVAVEKSEWARYDRMVYRDPLGVGAAGFLSLLEDVCVGFASFDPRQWPDTGIIGHNCVLPEYRGRGFGILQIREVLRLFSAKGFRRAVVSTGDIAFFEPARRMYLACGFIEVGAIPGDPRWQYGLIEYVREVS